MSEQLKSTPDNLGNKNRLPPFILGDMSARQAILPSLVPGLGSWAYRASGGGENLKPVPPSQWPRVWREAYAQQLINPKGDNDRLGEQVEPFLHAMGDQLDPVVTQDIRNAPVRGKITEADKQRMNPYVSNYITGEKSQGAVVATLVSKLRAQEYRARAIENLANTGQWALLAGLLYGGAKNWRKLLIEKDLEQVTPTEKTAVLKVPKSPSESQVALFPGDSYALLPAVGVAGALGGYQLMDWLTDRARKKALENKRRAATQEFQQLFSQSLQQPKLASVLEKVAEMPEEPTTKQAWMESLPIGAQAAIYGSPLVLGTLAFLAAQGVGRREARKERRTAMQAIRAAQMTRVPQIEFVPAQNAGDLEQQGFMSNRYRVPIAMDTAPAREEQPPELDLTKLSAFMKLAAETPMEWKPPQNTPIASPQPAAPIGSGKPGDPHYGPKPAPVTTAPKVPEAPRGPVGSAERFAKLPTNWTSGKVGDAIVDVGRFWKGQAGDVGADAIGKFFANQTNRDNLSSTGANALTQVIQKPENQQAVVGVGNQLVQENLPWLPAVNNYMSQATSGSPQGIGQWLVGRALGNPNAQGLGSMLSQQPLLAAMMQGAPAAAGDAFSFMGNMAAPLTAKT